VKYQVDASLNRMYRSRTGKCTEVDSFTACAYLCTEVDLYRNRLPFVPNSSCTELDLPRGQAGETGTASVVLQCKCRFIRCYKATVTVTVASIQ